MAAARRPGDPDLLEFINVDDTVIYKKKTHVVTHKNKTTRGYYEYYIEDESGNVRTATRPQLTKLYIPAIMAAAGDDLSAMMDDSATDELISNISHIFHINPEPGVLVPRTSSPVQQVRYLSFKNR